MCTLIALIDVVPGCPLVIAANRDERPSRRSAAPAYRSKDVFAPEDLVKRGTWLGVSKRGWLAGLTNFDDWHGLRTEGRCSRGTLVARCLEARSFEAALDIATYAEPRDYPGYHLFLSNGSSHVLFRNDGRDRGVKSLFAGVHTVTAMGSGTDHCERSRRIFRAAKSEADEFTERPSSYRQLDALLGFHSETEDSEEGSCVHAPNDGFQTVSSMTIALDANTREWHVRWRNGKPCENRRWRGARVPINAR